MFDEKLDYELNVFFKTRPVFARFARFDRTCSDSQLGQVEDTRLHLSLARREERYLSRQLKDDVRDGLIQQGVNSQSIYTSVSHTQLGGETWVVVIGSDRRVGVDLENHSREVSQSVLARICLEPESRFGLQPLEFWVAKEAAFKANSKNHNTFVSQYTVIQWDPSTRLGTIGFPGGEKQEKFEFKLFTLGAWLFAIAIACTESEIENGK